MKKEYTATIKYRFDAGDDLPEGAEAGTLYTFADTYRIDPDIHDNRSARAYIKNDLRLVAGGGYAPINEKNILGITMERTQ